VGILIIHGAAVEVSANLVAVIDSLGSCHTALNHAAEKQHFRPFGNQA